MRLFGKIFLLGFLRGIILSAFILLVVFLFKVIYTPAALKGSTAQFAENGAIWVLLFALVCGVASVVLNQVKSLNRNASNLEKS